MLKKCSQRQSSTWLMVRMIVHWPFLVAFFSLLLCIGLSAWALSLNIVLDKRTDAFRVNTHIATMNYDSVDVAFDKTHEYSGDSEKRLVLQGELDSRRVNGFGGIGLVYISKDGSEDVLIPPQLTKIRDIEKKITELPGYKDFCKVHQKREIIQRDGTVALPPEQWKWECEPVGSLANFFFPTLYKNATRNYLLYDVYDFDGRGDLYPVPSSVKNALVYGRIGVDALDRKFNIWYQHSRGLRSYLAWGCPLEGYEDCNDRRDEQEEKRLQFLMTVADYLKTCGDDTLGVYYEGSGITNWEIDWIIYKDVALAVGSVIFVYVWMIVHTQSLVLSTAGIIHIIVSIPTGFWVIRVVLQDYNFGILMCMVLFVILGIGCDDIFIFIDAWRQSFSLLSNSTPLVHRMDWVYKRAFGATFITSITTAAAFLSNGMSAIVPIKIFGIFMGVIVLMNFFLCVTFYPSIIVLWYKYCSHSCACFRCWAPDYIAYDPSLKDVT